MGAALVARLSQGGAEVVAIDRRPPETPAPPNVTFRAMDLLDTSALTRVVAELGPEAWVFHLAGIAHAGECEKNPQAAFAANVGGGGLPNAPHIRLNLPVSESNTMTRLLP